MTTDLKELKAKLLQQDNYATALPMYTVQQKRTIIGVSPDYTEKFIYVNSHGDEVDENDDSAQKVGIVEIWEFVTTFFTEDACKKYIADNKHNLNEARMYVDSGYRNAEWELIRNLILSTPD